MNKISMSLIKCVTCGKRGSKIGNIYYNSRISSENLLNRMINFLIQTENNPIKQGYICQNCRMTVLRNDVTVEYDYSCFQNAVVDLHLDILDDNTCQK